MPTSRCPIVRPQFGWAGARGFTTDYHSWPKDGGPCRFCGQPRKQTKTTQHDRFWGEDEQSVAGRAPPHERFDAAPLKPDRWASVTSLLQPPQRSLI